MRNYVWKKVKVQKDKRTILEYLLKLPPDIAVKAIKNAGETANKDFVGNTIKDAVMSAFVWNTAPEGGEYWNDFINNQLL